MYPNPFASRPTLLLVEDDALLQLVMTEAFEERGWDVIAVAAAEDALGHALMDTPFDAVLTDIDLAGPLNGWELAETLRDMRPGLPLAYASGHAEKADQAQSVPDSPFFAKPYDVDAVARELGERVRANSGCAGQPAWALPANDRALALSA